MPWVKAINDWWAKYVGILALPILIGAVLLAWLQPVVPASLFCGPNEACLREWVGALSGWVAALVAIPSAYLLLKQLSELRRQTAFQVGDAPPTMQVSALATELGGCQLKVTNWNRRAFVITMIEVDTPVKVGWWNSIALVPKPEIGGVYNIANGGKLKPSLWIQGWEDKSSAPPSANFEVIFTEEDSAFAANSNFNDIECTVIVRGYINREIRELSSLSVTAPFNQIAAYTSDED